MSCRRDDKVAPAPGRRHHAEREPTPSIAKGVDAGDRVVTTGFARLKDGARVTVATPEEQKSARSLRPRRTPSRACRRRACSVRTACADDMRSCAPTPSAARPRSLPAGQRRQLSDACKAATAAARGGSDAKRSAQGRRQHDPMSVSAPFITRPIATSLLGFAVLLGGALGYWLLPVSSLPQVDFPTIQVTTQLPGANPETTANLVTAPLERQLGQIPALATMTSSSSYGISQITLQFDLDRDIDAAAQDVQSAINAAGSTLPRNLPYPPTYSKVNPADAPIITLALTSDTIPLRNLSDLADTLMAQRLSSGARRRPRVGRGRHQARRCASRPTSPRLASYGLSMADLRTAIVGANVVRPQGLARRPATSPTPSPPTTRSPAPRPTAPSSSPIATMRRCC